MLALALGMCPASVLAQGKSPLVITGKGDLRSVSLVEGEQLALAIELSNASGGPVEVARAETFLACEGGWAYSLGESIGQGKGFFGNGTTVSSGQHRYQLGYSFSTPVTHYLLALQLRRQNQPARDFVFEVPFTRAGFAAPEPLKAIAPVFMTLQEPLEAVPLASGGLWISIVGQMVNTSGKPLTLKKWRLTLQSSGGATVIDRDLTANFPLERNTHSVEPFLLAFNLPPDFRAGKLALKGEVDLGAGPVAITRSAKVTRAAPRVVRAPVQGAWIWANGQGSLNLHTHYRFPEQRYCYDIVMPGPDRKTSHGDPRSNASFHAWDRPILAVEDGKASIVINDVPDNFGTTENPANNPRRNASIVLEHAGGGYSVYNHVQKGTARVKVGQRVKAGDVIGRVGNAGFSSEPHLHFGYMVLDKTGRVRNVPVRIKGLRTANGQPADRGVPKSDEEYTSSAPAQQAR